MCTVRNKENQHKLCLHSNTESVLHLPDIIYIIASQSRLQWLVQGEAVCISLPCLPDTLIQYCTAVTINHRVMTFSRRPHLLAEFATYWRQWILSPWTRERILQYIVQYVRNHSLHGVYTVKLLENPDQCVWDRCNLCVDAIQLFSCRN